MSLHRGKFSLDMLKATVHIYICEDADCTRDQANKIIRKYKEEPYEHPCHGMVFNPDEDRSINFLFLSAENLTVNTITHETDHIRNNIIDHYSIVEKEDGRETSAIVNGYINEKVFQFLQKRKVKFTF